MMITGSRPWLAILLLGELALSEVNIEAWSCPPPQKAGAYSVDDITDHPTPPDPYCDAVKGWAKLDYVKEWSNPTISVPGFMSTWNGGVSAIYTGYLKTTALGTYKFKLRSDDGSKLFISDMSTPVCTLDRQVNAPCGDCESAEGQLALPADYYTQIRVLYYNYFSTTLLGLYWNGPDSNNVWQEVPSTSLFTTIPGCLEGQYNAAAEGLPIDCKTCPIGRYRSTNMGNGVDSCSLCFAGYYGDDSLWTDGPNGVQQGNLQSTCTGKCAAGHFCLEGSEKSTANPCPAGTYGKVVGLSNKGCSGNCMKGHYCPERSICQWGQIDGDPSTCSAGDGSVKKCKAGNYGPGGSADVECFGQCLEGSWCGEGSYQSDQNSCWTMPGGGQYDPPQQVYCPKGSEAPLFVGQGNYSFGFDNVIGDKQFEQRICTKGSYCVKGVLTNCPKGRYGNQTGLSSADCSGPCLAGYDCPPKSIRPNFQECASVSETHPENFYCPLGKGQLAVPADFYSIQADGTDVGNRYFRVGIKECDKVKYEVCLNGKREVNLQWGEDSACASGGDQVFSISENNMNAIGTISATLTEAGPISFKIDDAVGVTPPPVNGGAIPKIEITSSAPGNVKSAMGTLKVTNPGLDFENEELQKAEGIYTVPVIVSTTGGESRSCTVKLQVTNVNEAPIVDAENCAGVCPSDYTFSVIEGSIKGYAVGSSVKDYATDDGGKADITFELEAGAITVTKYAPGITDAKVPAAAKAPFSINQCSGQLSLSVDDGIDYELVHQYSVEVTASDGGDPKESSKRTFYVDVNNKAEAPVLTKGLVLQVAENSLADVACIPALQATDNDEGDSANLVYQITSYYGLAEAFSINPAKTDKAPVLVSAAGVGILNYEKASEWNIKVQVKDPNNLLSDEVQVTINITNSNDPPVLEDLTLAVSENTAKDTVVAESHVVKDDPFLADRCVDKEGKPYTDRFCVYEEDKLPKWSMAGGTFIATLKSGKDWFSVDSVTGKVSVKSDEVNFEAFEASEAKQCKYDVTVTDKGGATGKAVLTINILDVHEQPFIPAGQIVSIPESSFGASSSPAITHTDPDDPDGKKGLLVSWALLSGGSGELTIPASSGSGTINAVGTLDFETTSEYEVMVKVTDNTGLFNESKVTVKVTDVNDPPVMPDISLNCSENFAQKFSPKYYDPALDLAADNSERLVGELPEATDEDEVHTPQTIVYSLDGDLTKYFEIKMAAKVPQLWIKASTALDFDGGVKKFSGTVTATDQDKATGVGQLTVNLKNVNDPPYFEVAQDHIMGTVGTSDLDGGVTPVGSGLQYLARDEDGDIVTWAVKLADGEDAKYSSVFAIKGNNLVLQDKSALKDSPPSTITLQITATDPSKLSSTNTFVVNIRKDIDESAPEFLNTDITLSVAECFAKPVGGKAQLGPVTCTQGGLYTFDKCPSPHDAVKYPDCKVMDKENWDLMRFNVTGTKYFEMDISTNPPKLVVTPAFQQFVDFESDWLNDDNFKFVVIATDPTKATAQAAINIVLTNVNEYPKISLSADDCVVDEATKDAVVSCTLNGLDPDTSDSSSLEWSLSGPGASNFELEQVKGATPSNKLKASSDAVDFEGVGTYTLIAHLKDQLGHQFNKSFTVKANDINEPPSFVPPLSITRKECTSTEVGCRVSDLLGTLNVTDPDTDPENAKLLFAMESNKYFYIDPLYNKDIGKVLINNGLDGLDYESTTNGEYSFTVTVYDRYNNDALSTSVTKAIKVLIEDVNDMVITAVHGTSEMNCDGDESLTIVGNNLYRTWGAQPSIRVSYGPIKFLEDSPSKIDTALSNVNKYVATGCQLSYDAGSSTVQNITCKTVPGIGGNLGWNVTVGDKFWQVSPNNILSSYAKPMIMGAIFSSEPTTDNKPSVVITLSGQNFGPTTDSPDPDLQVVYEYDKLEMQAANCKVTQTNSQIKCDSVVGVGKDLSFFIDLTGDISDKKETNLKYAAPVVTEVIVSKLKVGRNRVLVDDSNWEPIDSADMETLGGQRIEIRGQNFGDGNTLNNFILRYGTANGWLTAPVCEPSSTPHSVMYCESAPGVGFQMQFIATVGGTSSAPCGSALCLASYKIPRLTGIGGLGTADADTKGGQVVYLYGVNLGAGKVDALVKANYGPLSAVTKVGGEDVVGGFSAKNCTIKEDAEGNYISCLTGEGTGRNLVWQVVLGGKYSNILVANTSYGAPVVLKLDGPGAVGGATVGNEIVDISGYNFGPLGTAVTASYGPQGTEYKAFCSVKNAHVQLECRTTEGAGKEHKWVVVVDSQVSRQPTSSYARPSISYFTGLGAKFALTSGHQLISIHGDNFGPADEIVLVRGDVTYGPASEPDRYKANNCSVISHAEIQCLTVPGSGATLKWVVRIKEQVSDLSINSTSYAKPSILAITPPLGPTSGGTLITLTGTNFGDEPRIFYNKNVEPELLVGKMVVWDAQDGTPYHNVTFALPSGIGQNIPIEVEVGEGASLLRGPDPPALFNYQAPVIETLSMSGGSGGGTLSVTIYGSNFGGTGGTGLGGVFFNSSEFLLDPTCADVLAVNCVNAWSHNRISVRVPAAKTGWIQVAVGNLTHKNGDGTYPVQFSCSEKPNKFDAGDRSKYLGAGSPACRGTLFNNDQPTILPLSKRVDGPDFINNCKGDDGYCNIYECEQAYGKKLPCKYFSLMNGAQAIDQSVGSPTRAGFNLTLEGINFGKVELNQNNNKYEYSPFNGKKKDLNGKYYSFDLVKEKMPTILLGEAESVFTGNAVKCKWPRSSEACEALNKIEPNSWNPELPCCFSVCDMAPFWPEWPKPIGEKGRVQIRCTMPAGQGELQVWAVNDGLFSESHSLKYLAPTAVLKALNTPYVSDTQGTEYEFIGTNLGFNPFIEIAGELSKNILVNAEHTQLTVQLAEGQGLQQPLEMSVGGQKTTTLKGVVSYKGVVNYNPPKILSILDGQGKDELLIVGRNFGAEGLGDGRHVLKIGDRICDLISVKHTEIKTHTYCSAQNPMNYSELLGNNITLEVSGQFTSFAAPEITQHKDPNGRLTYVAFAAATVEENNAYAAWTEGPICCIKTAAGTTLVITGNNFGTDPEVTVGQHQEGKTVKCEALTLTDDNVRWQCTMPEGYGGKGELIVSNGALRSYPVKINFLKPEIFWDKVVRTSAPVDPKALKTKVGDNAFPCLPSPAVCTYVEVPVTGGDFVVPGNNLGKGGEQFSGKLMLLDKNADGEEILFAPVNNTHNDTYITFSIPEGEGGRHNIIMDVSGQRSADQRLDYQTPEIAEVEITPATVADTDGTLAGVQPNWLSVVIKGKHFGTDATQNLLWSKGLQSYHYAQVGDMVCRNVTLWSDELIKCSIPPWQGKGLRVRVNVTGVWGASPDEVLSYTAPHLLQASMAAPGKAMEPCNKDTCMCPTEGGLPMKITGTNLGVARPQFGGLTARETQNLVPFLVDKDAKSGRSKIYVGQNLVPNVWIDTFEHTDVSFKCPEDPGRGCPAGEETCIKGRMLVVVRAGNQNTPESAYTLRYSTPSVSNVSPNDGGTSGGTVLTIQGSSFGSNASYTTVYLGDPAMAEADPEVLAQSEELGYICKGMCQTDVDTGCILEHSHTEIKLRTPGGIGKNLVVSVATGWGRSDNTAPATFFSFDPPIVQKVSAYWPDRPVKLYGQNFGAFPTKVRAHVEGVECAKTSWHAGVSTSEIEEERVPFLECLPGEITKYHETTRYVRGSAMKDVTRLNETSNTTYNEKVFVGETFECFKHTAGGEVECLRKDCPKCANVDEETACGCCTFDMQAEVGRQKSASHNFTYTTPVVQTVTPNEPDVNSSLTITGQNFGDYNVPRIYKALFPDSNHSSPNITVFIGDDECINDKGGRGKDDGWFLGGLSYNNQPILKCDLNNVRVGPKKFSVNVASLTYSFNESEAFISPGCKRDYFGGNGERCGPCPVGGVCEGGLAEPYAREGFWLTQLKQPSPFCTTNTGNRSTCPHFQPCEPKDSCIGGSCDGDSCCAVGYSRERCGTCAEDYYRINGICEECPKCPICVFIIFFLVAMGALAMGWVLQRKEINVGLTSIGVDYFQVLATFAQTRIEWPQTILSLYNALSFFNLNIELTAPECSFQFGYATKWFLIECIPLIGFGIFLFAHWGKYFHKRCIKNRRNKLHSHVHTMIGVCLVLMYYGYLYICKSTLDVMNCGPTDPYDGFEYMDAVFEKCWHGGLHGFLFPWAIFFFMVYAIGYPGLVAFILYRGRESAREDQLLRANDTGSTRKSNPNCYDFRKRYHKMYYMFKPDFTWWVLIILLRKFLISIITIIFRRNALFQMATMLLVLFAAFAIQVVYRPYMSMSERKTVLEEHARRLAEGDSQASAAINRQQSGRRHKNLRLGDTTTPTLREQTMATANYFFNYNTVEAYLLTAAIIVALSGVMFESDRFGNDKYEGQKGALTAWVIFVITISIVYWLTVFGTEVALTIKPDLWQKKATKEKKKGEENDGFEMKQGLNPLHHQSSAGGVDTDAVARANVSKAQAEAALGRHKNVIDEQSKEILDLKKKVQAQALSSSSSRRLKQKASGKGGKKTKKAFRPGDEEGDGTALVSSKMDLDEAHDSMGQQPMASV